MTELWTVSAGQIGGVISTPTAEVRNLEPGQEYEFRVMAQNSNGLSEPLLTSEPILAKLPYGEIHTSTNSLFIYIFF